MCKNLRTTKLDQDLLVLIQKKKRVACFLYQPYRRRMLQLSRSRAVLCSEEMQKRDSKNLPLSYYIFGAVNNSQLDSKSIGKSLVGAKPIWQRKKLSVVKCWAVSTIVISQILHRLLEALFINLEATAPSEALGGGGGYSNARSKFITSPCRTEEF